MLWLWLSRFGSLDVFCFWDLRQRLNLLYFLFVPGKGKDYWEEENISEEMPACRQMFNIFHPFDPVAYRSVAFQLSWLKYVIWNLICTNTLSDIIWDVAHIGRYLVDIVKWKLKWRETIYYKILRPKFMLKMPPMYIRFNYIYCNEASALEITCRSHIRLVTAKAVVTHS